MAGSEPRSGVAVRLLSVLDVFEGAVVPLRLSTIAERSGLPAATTLRLLRELVEWGGIEKLDDGTYRVGLRMWSIGALAPCVQRIQRETTWLIRRLAATTGATAILACPAGDAALVIDRAGQGSIQIGDRLPLHSTAVGKILLSEFSPRRTAAVLAAARRTTTFTRTDIVDVRRELDGIASSGVARELQEHAYGVCSLAVPILRPDGDIGAALGIVGTASLDEKACRELLLEATDSVTASIMR